MTEDSPLDGFRVLLLDESATRRALFDRWLGDVPVTCVADPEQIAAAFSGTVAVACLSQEALGDAEDTVHTHVLSRNPYCQLVTILPRGSFRTPYEDRYDAVLQRPVIEDSLRETVGHRLQVGVYTILLREFYELNTRMHWLHRGDTPSESELSVEPDEIRARYFDVASRLDALQAKLSTAVITDISASLDRHRSYLTTPSGETTEATEAKYHPARCPGCKLSWGVDHGNELGSGMKSISAGVWRCTRCNEIAHGLGESGRRVM